jgi:hypothetical protein
LFAETIKHFNLSKSLTLFFVKQGVRERFCVAHYPTNVERKVFVSFEIPVVVMVMAMGIFVS